MHSTALTLIAGDEYLLYTHKILKADTVHMLITIELMIVCKEFPTTRYSHKHLLTKIGFSTMSLITFLSRMRTVSSLLCRNVYKHNIYTWK